MLSLEKHMHAGNVTLSVILTQLLHILLHSRLHLVGKPQLWRTTSQQEAIYENAEDQTVMKKASLTNSFP